METYDIPMLLRTAYLSMHRQFNAHLRSIGITADQFACLLILTQKKGLIQKELVKHVSSDPNTIRAILVLLEKRGHVKRRPHPDDNRARIVSISSQGRRIVSEAIDILKPVRDRLETELTEDDAKSLNHFLLRINEAMIK